MRPILLRAAIIAFALPGCAASWEDGRGTRHVLGLGYFAIPAAAPAPDVRVSGVDVLGLGIVRHLDATHLALGYLRTRAVTLGPEGAAALPCLDCDIDHLADARPTGGTP